MCNAHPIFFYLGDDYFLKVHYLTYKYMNLKHKKVSLFIDFIVYTLVKND